MNHHRHQVLSLFGLTLLVCSLSLIPPFAYADARLSTDVVPTSESITLKINAARLEYTGTAEFQLRVKEPTNTFNFHAKGLRIDKLVLTRNGEDVPAEFGQKEYAIIEVRTSGPLKPGTASMKVEFTNWLDTTSTSLFRIIEDNEGNTFTQFEPAEARGAFPCWDEPSFKIPFQMTLIVPEAHTAVFNTPIERESIADGWKTIVFRRTKPLPTYLLAFATGPLESVPIPQMSIPGRVITVRGKTRLAEEAIAIAPQVLAALEKYFGQKYPYEKLDLIAVPGMGGAMENAGAVTFADNLLLLEPGRISVSQRRALASVMAHELAHMWFGDLVTLAWWDDTWLNESFASWMGDKITHEVFPEYGMDISKVRSANDVMETDARASTRAIRRPVEAVDNLALAFDDLAYSKGQAVLGMFEQWLGPETFRQGLLEYLKVHAWGTATAQDFWSALSHASGKDIEATVAPYFDQPGVPWVSAELMLDNRVRLTQKRFANYGTTLPTGLWNIPVVLGYSDGKGTKTQTILLDQPEKTIELSALEGNVAWILPNANMDGYYRWSVAPDMLVRLAEHPQERGVGERVGVIGNLGALLDAGTISGDNYLRTLSQFADDSNPEVISVLLSALGKIRTAFVTDENEDEFGKYVRRTLGPALQRFGLARLADETETVTRVRSQLISWLGNEGEDPRVNTYADSLATVYMKDPSAVDPQLAGVFLSLSAAHGDRAFFDECRRRFETAQVPTERSRFLYLLGSFRNPDLLNEALQYGMKGPLRPTEILTIPDAAMSYRKNEDVVFQWVLDHYDEILSRLPPEYAAFMPFIANGCSRVRLAKAQEFFAMPGHHVAGTEEQLAKVTEQVNDCNGLREREGAAVNQYMRKFAGGTDR